MRAPRLRLLLLAVAAIITALAVYRATSPGSHVNASPPGRLHVSGNRLLDASGRPVIFHGVNRSGTEYACIQGWGIFDGPSGARSVNAMASWHINAVRIPLNEDCWLGINGVNPRFAGARYRTAIVDYVRLLHRYGMYAEISLIWGAPAAYRATYQSGAPDADHSPEVWASLARTFRGDPDVVLAPWGETSTGWRCFMHGCSDEATFGPRNTPYRTAGMQEAVTVMRRAGYTGPIAVPCIAYANLCGTLPDGSNYNGSTWVLSHPSDRDRQILAEVHIYGKNQCDSVACLDASVLPILRAGYPVIFGETGETYDSSECGSSYVAKLLPWADANHVGYETWAWDTWRTCSALIDDYAGSPHAAFGAWIKAHYVSQPVRLLDAEG
jgi:hypothetical protein